MDVKLGILILLNMAPPQKLVLAPGAIITGSTVNIMCAYVDRVTYYDLQDAFVPFL